MFQFFSLHNYKFWSEEATILKKILNEFLEFFLGMYELDEHSSIIRTNPQSVFINVINLLSRLLNFFDPRE